MRLGVQLRPKGLESRPFSGFSPVILSFSKDVQRGHGRFMLIEHMFDVKGWPELEIAERDSSDTGREVNL